MKKKNGKNRKRTAAIRSTVRFGRLAEIIEDRAKECGKSSQKNAEPYAACFVVMGIVLSDLAETIRREAQR